VGGNDAPAFRQSDPRLALPSSYELSILGALELQCDATEVTSECDDVEPVHCPRQIRSRAAFSKSRDLFDAVQVLCEAHAHRVIGTPEHLRQLLDIVLHKGGLVLRIERLQFGEGF